MSVTAPLEEANDFKTTGVFEVGVNTHANVERLLDGLEKPLIQGPHLTSQLEKLHSDEVDQGMEGEDGSKEQLRELMENAAHFAQPHKELTQEVAQAANAKSYEIGRQKEEGRIVKKCVADKCTLNMIGDVARSTILFDDLESLYRSVIELYKRAEIVRVKDRFVNPRQSGYRDLLFNVKLKDPETGKYHITEIQFQLEAMKKAKYEEYPLYNKRRDKQRELVECHEEDPNNEIRIKELETDIGWFSGKSSEIFEDAWVSYDGKLDGYREWAAGMVA